MPNTPSSQTNATVVAILTACVICMAALVCFSPNDLTAIIFGAVAVGLLLTMT